MFKHLDILDEKHVEIVANAIADDRIGCVIEDIRSASDNDESLYGECLARLIGPDGRMYAASAFVPCLHVLREVSMLDRHMVKLVLDLLDADPMSVLGCNLSADSIADAAVWNDILDQLHHRSHLAPRIVLEVTEAHGLNSLLFCVDKIAEARSLGCLFALDDFGAGFASPRLIQLIDFDIIKINQAFVCDIRPSFEERNSLQNIVGLASSFAPRIVVEGVETVAQIEAARAAGATHFQGNFFSDSVTRDVAKACKNFESFQHL